MSPVTGLLFSVHTMFIHDFLVFTKPYSHVFISWRAELIFRVQKICNDDMFHAQVFSKAFNLILEKKSDAKKS